MITVELTLDMYPEDTVPGTRGHMDGWMDGRGQSRTTREGGVITSWETSQWMESIKVCNSRQRGPTRQGSRVKRGRGRGGAKAETID